MLLEIAVPEPRTFGILFVLGAVLILIWRPVRRVVDHPVVIGS